LITQITFYVNNKEGDELIPSADLFLTRDMDFSVSAPTAAESLEILLVSDMRQDIVSQIVRRLATLQSKKPVVTPVQ
jgi:LPS-assembly lipoprotein